MRLMVDSNIVIDYLTERHPFYEPAELLMALGEVGEAELWLSCAQVNDIFYIVTKGGKRASRSLKERLKQLRRFLNICNAGSMEFDAVLDSSWDDLEDACVYQCALAIKADAIVTRNGKDFAKSSLPVYSCGELLAYLYETRQVEYDLLKML